jgi:hypothetical protein
VSHPSILPLSNTFTTLGGRSRGSLVNVLIRLRAGGTRFESRQGLTFFSLLHRVQTGSGTHPASYSVGIEGSFLAGKAAGAWNWLLTCI